MSSTATLNSRTEYREGVGVEPVRIVEHIHGHLGWLAAVALVHPAALLRHKTRRAHLAVAIPTVLVTLTAGIGAWLYAPYRQELRPTIFLHSPAMGLLFERKEHLAVGAVVFAWAGAAAYFSAPRATPDIREQLRVLAYHAFCAAAILGVLVAILGTTVATYRTF